MILKGVEDFVLFELLAGQALVGPLLHLARQGQEVVDEVGELGVLDKVLDQRKHPAARKLQTRSINNTKQPGN